MRPFSCSQHFAEEKRIFFIAQTKVPFTQDAEHLATDIRTAVNGSVNTARM